MMKSKYILALTIPAIFGCAVNEITPEAPGAEEGLIPITWGIISSKNTRRAQTRTDSRTKTRSVRSSWTMRTANPES